ncbi:MAG: hypothetical protein AAB600_05020 [Patescibacteria group bacterium]
MILLMDNQDQPQNFSDLQPTPASPRMFLNIRNIPTKYIIIFLAVLAVLSSGSTGYLLFANKKKVLPPKTIQEEILVAPPIFTPIPTPTKVPTPTITPTPTLAPLVDPIATWSAFVSTKYAYSIKYPPDWTAKITTQQDPKILEYVVFNPKDATKAGSLSITSSYGTRTYKEALALDPQKGATVTVASVSATRKNQQDSDGNISINVITPTGANTIVIKAEEKYRNILDIMLTTVKLTQ